MHGHDVGPGEGAHMSDELGQATVLEELVVVAKVLDFGDGPLAVEELRFGYRDVLHHGHARDAQFFCAYLLKSSAQPAQFVGCD